MTRVYSVPFEIVPLGTLGAEIRGIDLRKTISEKISRHLRTALASYQLLLFREQDLSPAEQIQFTRCFGMPEPGIARRPEEHQVKEYPDILYLSNETGSPTLDYGFSWHSDGLAYAKVPHGVTILYCIACPKGVGDTLFASQYKAYEAMPDSLCELLGGLYWYLPDIAFSEVPPGKRLAQPMVRIHPITEKKFLFVSPNAKQLRGKSPVESELILSTVRNYQIRADVIYRHAFGKGDLLLWENCALLHNRADTVDPRTQGLRIMHRSATSGDFEAMECETAET